MPSRKKFGLYFAQAMLFVAATSMLKAESTGISDLGAILKLALSNDSRIAQAEAWLKKAGGEAINASAFDNPELSLAGSQASSDSSAQKAGVTLLQPFGLAGAKSARKRQALHERDAALQSLKMLRVEISGTVISRLARLRQIREELPVLDEGQELCTQALARFKRLAYLSPEQAGSRRAFQWSLETLQLHAAELTQESEELEASLGQTLGTAQADPAWSNLVPHRESWPAWPDTAVDSPQLLEAKSERMAAAEGLKAARAEAWPSLSLGPSFEMEPGEAAGTTKTFVGGELNWALPLWNRNKGGSLAAEGELHYSEKHLKQTQIKVETMKRVLRQRYERLVRLLTQDSGHDDDGLKELHRIQGEYLAGRLPATLALEVLRQFQDFIEARHSRELEAMETLWQGHALAGKEEILWP